ncbi:MAG: response regulator [Proteobacteria bacterium]|nr:response regulator [Pseudomonadota bacterium]
MAKRKKIFLVEDNSEMRAGYKAALEAAGYAVVDFASVPEAFGAWHDHAATTDLILSDHNLGFGSRSTMFGTELLRFVRHSRYTGPFVMMSTDPLEELEGGDVKLLLEADPKIWGGYSAYVQKDLSTRDNVVAAVAEALAAAGKSAAPVQQVVAEEPPRGQPPRHRRDRPLTTILLVEDSDVLRRAIKKDLEAAGYKVVAVSTLREAVGRWNKDSADIDLVLSDYNLGNGIEYGNELYKLVRKTSDKPFVLMSSGSLVPSVRAAVEGDNHFGFVLKGTDFKNIIAAVRMFRPVDRKKPSRPRPRKAVRARAKTQ